ncbi:MAG: dephospho-CoA kinase [bacterium]|nr:dephospho-CoA kinase [bacterium]
MANRPKLVGLTGNMGCGKSVVAKFLSELPKIVVISTDEIAKDIVSDPQHRNKIEEIFGALVFDDNKPDFQLMAETFFSNPDVKRQFEDFVHPLVWQAVDNRINELPDDSVVVIESALIFENSNRWRFDEVVLVTCKQREQYRRLIVERGLTPDQIDVRLKYQLPADQKIWQSDWVVHTDGSIQDLKTEIVNLHRQLIQHL